MRIPLVDMTKKELGWSSLAIAAGYTAMQLAERAEPLLVAGEYAAALLWATPAAALGLVAVWTLIPDAPKPGLPHDPVGPAARDAMPINTAAGEIDSLDTLRR